VRLFREALQHCYLRQPGSDQLLVAKGSTPSTYIPDMRAFSRAEVPDRTKVASARASWPRNPHPIQELDLSYNL
jgi:hypothetical protein